MRRATCSLACTLAAGLVALLSAAPALADGEPPVPLRASTVHLVVTGIVVATVAVVAAVALYHLGAAVHSARRRRATRDGEGR